MRRADLSCVMLSACFTLPAVAQLPPRVVVNWYSAPGWGGYSWGGVWVVQPPVVIVRPLREPRISEPREPLPAPENPREVAAAAARVNQAVSRGELKVITPGKPVARMPAADEPPPLIAPKPVVPLADPKPPAEPKALAAFRVRVGQQAFEEGEYGRAAAQFQAALKADWADPLPHFLLAQARSARGEFAEAVAAIQDGLRRAPDWPRSTFRLADLYGRTPERLVGHLAAVRAAAEAKPAESTARFLYAYQLWFTGNRANAALLFRDLRLGVKDPADIDRFLQVFDTPGK